MSLISHMELVSLIGNGLISEVPPSNINGASVDITLHHTLLVENMIGSRCGKHHIDLMEKDNVATSEFVMTDKCGYLLSPGEFVLASSYEVFNLPNNIAAEYKLKSSLARNGLNHLLAGWCDPGWSGSRLTLELHNTLRYHTLRLRPGMKIGQMVFWKCANVEDQFAYGARGQYNKQTRVTASRGLR